MKKLLLTTITLTAIGVAVKVVDKKKRVTKGTINSKSIKMVNLSHPVQMNSDSLKELNENFHSFSRPIY